MRTLLGQAAAFILDHLRELQAFRRRRFRCAAAALALRRNARLGDLELDESPIAA